MNIAVAEAEKTEKTMAHVRRETVPLDNSGFAMCWLTPNTPAEQGELSKCYPRIVPKGFKRWFGYGPDGRLGFGIVKDAKSPGEGKAAGTDPAIAVATRLSIEQEMRAELGGQNLEDLQEEAGLLGVDYKPEWPFALLIDEIVGIKVPKECTKRGIK